MLTNTSDTPIEAFERAYPMKVLRYQLRSDRAVTAKTMETFRYSGQSTTMAFVIRRADGRFEIRESRSTPSGPRSRTLATFETMTDDVLDRAEDRAEKGFDRLALREGAERLGAPVGRSAADEAAKKLLGELGRGRRPTPRIAHVLATQLDASALPRDELAAVLPWLTATAEDRGRALVDLLALVDRLPTRRARARERFPRIDSTGAAK